MIHSPLNNSSEQLILVDVSKDIFVECYNLILLSISRDVLVEFTLYRNQTEIERYRMSVVIYI